MEKWKPAPGFAGYEVSDFGNIARVATYGKNPRSVWKPCAKRIKRGYVVFHLSCNGKVVDVQGHRLIWQAFYGPIPENLEINHKNGRRDDNRLDNLELMTRSQNCTHAFRHNGRPAPNNPSPGSRNGSAKLKEENISQIFDLYEDGYLQREIGEMFCVLQRTISMILRGEKWRHVSRAATQAVDIPELIRHRQLRRKSP